jgi:alginate O-acetyltransferase complex protein AlgI
MDFASLNFLFIFMPVFFTAYWLLPHQGIRNGLLLVGSAVFLAAGELIYFVLILALIICNYLIGRQIFSALNTEKPASRWVWLGVGLNLATLLSFKFLSTYSALLLPYLPPSAVPFFDHIPYPLGLSYLSFQFISYLLDIFLKREPAEENIFTFSLYILFFPKIIVGPITRYSQVRDQIAQRVISMDGVAAGLRRFITGLAKKVLIADQLGRVTNAAFGLASPEFGTGTAWFVLLAYALQLYFDFSGYIDMALGLAQCLGFTLPENFKYPYSAKSISEFWRRWHITLSSWFREYVFFPLERRRWNVAGQQLNTLIVFLLTGLWHGLTLPFIAWGLIHGAAVALEASGFGRKLKALPLALQHAYALTVILFGWIFFRSPSLPYAFSFLKRLFGLGGAIQPVSFSLSQPLPFIEPSVILAFCVGMLFVFPILPAIQNKVLQTWGEPRIARLVSLSLNDMALFALFFACILVLVGAAFKPGIYGGF